LKPFLQSIAYFGSMVLIALGSLAFFLMYGLFWLVVLIPRIAYQLYGGSDAKVGSDPRL